LLLRTTLDWNTTQRLQFITLQPTLTSATIPRLRSHTDAPKYYTTKAPGYYITIRLFRPAAPKLWSIPLPWVTTPLRHLNVTSQPLVLQFTTGRLFNTRSEISDLFICVRICRSYFNSY
jgi:hypothetical protein